MYITTKEITIYTFDELSEKAKARAREWLLDDPLRAEVFEDTVNDDLQNLFPSSDLRVSFSLGYCQGDGLNTCGQLDFSDMFTAAQRAPRVSGALDSFTEKEKSRLAFYLPYVAKYTLESDRSYCYSCKFLDLRYAEYTAHDWIEALQADYIRDIDSDLIRRFVRASFEWLDAYDREQEKAGYEELYPDDDALSEECVLNGFEFFENGEFAGCNLPF